MPNHETHSACNDRIEREGGNVKCCYCEPHEGCELNIIEQWNTRTPDLGKVLDDLIVAIERDGKFIGYYPFVKNGIDEALTAAKEVRRASQPAESRSPEQGE